MLETRMADPKPPFTASEQRDKLVWAEIAKERAAFDAKTARLKALRLAKEAEAPPPAPKPARVRAKAKKR
jgi:hypothetical protein